MYNACKPIALGKNATYIPQLATANPKLWAVAVEMVNGKTYSIGNTDVDFSIQSCSKPIMYAMALEQMGVSEYMKYVSCEPSGGRFNAFTLTQDENIPYNPFVNSGAIMTCALVFQGETPDVKFENTQNFFRKMSGHRIGFSNSIFLSERATADRNRALAYFMNEQKCFPSGTNLDEVLDFYFQTCSLEVNVHSLASLAATLANGGICPRTGRRVLSSQTVRNCLIMLFSCGMYDYSGSWAFHVGLPAKSGVSGCIMVVIPGVMGLATFSPPLDSRGNSVRGIEFCKRLTSKFNFHIFQQVVGTDLGQTAIKRTFFKDINQSTHIGSRSLVAEACEAAANGNVEALEKLLGVGINFDEGDYDKRTPLHVASANGHLEAVKFLVSKGAHLDVKDRWGNTPLDEAVREGRTECEKFLKSKKARSGKPSLSKVNSSENLLSDDDSQGSFVSNGTSGSIPEQQRAEKSKSKRNWKFL